MFASESKNKKNFLCDETLCRRRAQIAARFSVCRAASCSAGVLALVSIGLRFCLELMMDPIRKGGRRIKTRIEAFGQPPAASLSERGKPRRKAFEFAACALLARAAPLASPAAPFCVLRGTASCSHCLPCTSWIPAHVSVEHGRQCRQAARAVQHRGVRQGLAVRFIVWCQDRKPERELRFLFVPRAAQRAGEAGLRRRYAFIGLRAALPVQPAGRPHPPASGPAVENRADGCFLSCTPCMEKGVGGLAPKS